MRPQKSNDHTTTNTYLENKNTVVSIFSLLFRIYVFCFEPASTTRGVPNSTWTRHLRRFRTPSWLGVRNPAVARRRLNRANSPALGGRLVSTPPDSGVSLGLPPRRNGACWWYSIPFHLGVDLEVPHRCRVLCELAHLGGSEKSPPQVGQFHGELGDAGEGALPPEPVAVRNPINRLCLWEMNRFCSWRNLTNEFCSWEIPVGFIGPSLGLPLASEGNVKALLANEEICVSLYLIKISFSLSDYLDLNQHGSPSEYPSVSKTYDSVNPV